jgi:hypothetical protein
VKRVLDQAGDNMKFIAVLGKKKVYEEDTMEGLLKQITNDKELTVGDLLYLRIYEYVSYLTMELKEKP